MGRIEFTGEQAEKFKGVRSWKGGNSFKNFTGNVEEMEEFAFGVYKLLNACGDNPERDGLQETPFRVAKAFAEYTKGYDEDPKEHLKKTFEVDHEDLVIVKDIEFNSLCEHHLAPFYGKAHIGYIPKNKVTGLSKFARLLDGYANRFQVQERLNNQVVQAIEEVLDPMGSMVVIEATHMCMCGRGVKKKESTTVTSATRGIFKLDRALKAEFVNLIKG